MDYKQLTRQDELNLLHNRLGQLEVEFYEKRILLAEAELVQSNDEAKLLAAVLASIDARHQLISDKIDKLQEPEYELEEATEEEAPEEAP